MSDKKTEFSFQGTPAPYCQKEGPHPPHRVGTYKTVRFGGLERFCRGEEGGGLTINVSENFSGSAETPSRYRGTYSQEEP